MSIPRLTDCIYLMDKYQMLDNIRQHSLMVARVALLLLAELAEDDKLVLPDNRLVLAGSLLHDIAKTPCLQDDCRHDEFGGEICRENGFAAVASIVEQHVILADHDKNRWLRGRFTAEDIVYYADKRVRHHLVVSLGEREDYIIERYGRGSTKVEDHIKENFIRCLEFEECLFRFLFFKPSQLEAELLRWGH